MIPFSGLATCLGPNPAPASWKPSHRLLVMRLTLRVIEQLRLLGERLPCRPHRVRCHWEAGFASTAARALNAIHHLERTAVTALHAVARSCRLQFVWRPRWSGGETEGPRSSSFRDRPDAADPAVFVITLKLARAGIGLLENTPPQGEQPANITIPRAGIEHASYNSNGAQVSVPAFLPGPPLTRLP